MGGQGVGTSRKPWSRSSEQKVGYYCPDHVFHTGRKVWPVSHSRAKAATPLR